MTPTLSRGAQTYYQTHVQSRSPLELVVMLYDGALRFLEQAAEAMAANDMATKAQTMSKAMAIVAELQSTLNLEQGGDVAAQLDGLYTHVTARLIEANVQRDRAPIDEVVGLLRPLRDAWSQIATGSASAA
jgi:flagellar secretion chaperone FliS